MYPPWFDPAFAVLRSSILPEMRKAAKTFNARGWRPVAAALLAVLLSPACAPDTVELNSERIEQRFGSYGIEVLSVENGVRRANLYSDEQGQRVCRTYAVVRMLGLPTAAAEPALLAAHEDVLAGASLGASLEEAGWQVSKATQYVGTLPALSPLPDWLALMGLESTERLALHVYRLSIKKGEETYEYADIIEVHHPDYLTVGELAVLYPSHAREPAAASARSAALALLATGD